MNDIDAPYDIEIVPMSRVPRSVGRASKYEWLYKRIHKLSPGEAAICITLPNKMSAQYLQHIACAVNRTHIEDVRLRQWTLPPNQFVRTRSEPIGDSKKYRLFVYLITKDTER